MLEARAPRATYRLGAAERVQMGGKVRPLLTQQTMK
jgi:hypothetical protein